MASLMRRSTTNLKVFQAAITRRYIQSGSSSPAQDAINAAKQNLNEALRTGESLKKQAASATENCAGSTKDSAHGVADKAKEAWESTKETAHKTKDNIFGKADEAKESVKETAKRNMNTKKDPSC